MKKIILSIALVVGSVLFSQPSNAADVARLKTLLKTTFSTHYEVRKCGENISRIIDEAIEAGIDLKGASLLKLKSPDFWELQAFSARNEVGKRRMFYMHYVLYADGWIFDYDFTDQPKVVKFEDYMGEMFVPRVKPDVPYDYRKSFRESFELYFYDAREFAKNGFDTRGIPEKHIPLTEFIDVERLISRIESRR